MEWRAQLPSDAQLRRALLLGVPALAAGGWLIRLWLRARQLPPGPVGVPLLGILPQLTRDHAEDDLCRLCDRYGPIVSYRMGTQLFIAVGSYQLLKEMLEDANFDGRPQSPGLQRSSQGCGILFTEGAVWQRQRRLALKTLRDFGFATARSVEMLDGQIDRIFGQLDALAECGGAASVIDMFTEATNGVIATLTLGVRFEKSDPDMEFVKKASKGLFTSRPLQGLGFLFPFLKGLLRFLPDPGSSINSLNDEMEKFICKHMSQRQRLLRQPAFEPECLCDIYLLEKRKAEAQGDFETFKDRQLIRAITELFFAGTDTTARSLEWLLIYMAFEPEVQRRVQQEIDSVIGGSRRPVMQDRRLLNFVSATIEESLRIVSLTAIGLMHRAMRPTMFRGYRIPDDAIIFPFAFGINRDPALWPEPDTFRPERFLDSSGCYSGPGKNVAFSIGRRACAGESLARMEMFLIFGAVMQRYEVGLSADCRRRRREILRGKMGILRTPGDYSLTFRLR